MQRDGARDVDRGVVVGATGPDSPFAAPTSAREKVSLAIIVLAWVSAVSSVVTISRMAQKK